MSRGFFKIDNALSDSGVLDTLSLCATRIFFRMARLADAQTGQAFPSLKKLCEWVNFGKTAVGKALNELFSKGLLVRLARGYRGSSTVYQVNNVRRPTSKEGRREVQLSLGFPAEPAGEIEPPRAGVFREIEPPAAVTTQTQTITQTKQHPLPAAAASPEGLALDVVVEEIVQATGMPKGAARSLARKHTHAAVKKSIVYMDAQPAVPNRAGYLTRLLQNGGPQISGRKAVVMPPPEELARRQERAKAQNSSAFYDEWFERAKANVKPVDLSRPVPVQEKQVARYAELNTLLRGGDPADAAERIALRQTRGLRR